MKQQEVIDGFKTERARLLEYLRELPEQAWDEPSLCEGWKVRDVVAHLVGNVDDAVNLRLENFGAPEFNQRQLEERAARTPAELLAEWDEKAPILDAIAEGSTAEQWDAMLDPLPMTLGQGAQRLLEDLWVHAHDIRLALGDPAVPGPGMRAVLEVVSWDLPARLTQIAPSVGRVTIDAGDGLPLEAVAGDGESVLVSGDPVALALAGTGRRKLDESAWDGEIKVTPAAGPELAAAFNIYGA